MVANTFGQYWWDNHKIHLKENVEEEKMREFEAMERRKRDNEVNDEMANLRLVKARLGIRYYLMPWLIPGEKKKIAKIAALEKELDALVKKTPDTTDMLA